MGERTVLEMATELPSVRVFFSEDFASLVKREAEVFEMNVSQLIRGAARRQLGAPTPTPAVLTKASTLEPVTRPKPIRVHAEGDMLKRIEAAAEREGIALHHWIEAAVIVHVKALYGVYIEEHEERIRGYRTLRDEFSKTVGYFDHKGGWPALYERLAPSTSN